MPGVSVLGVRSLRQLIAVLTDEPVPEEEPVRRTGSPDPMLAGLMVPGAGVGTGLAREPADGSPTWPMSPDSAAARTALEVAAAGGHHLLLHGPPGAGKTMLAERLPGLLPPLTRQESLEVTAVHSVAGILPPGEPLVRTPPYCAPHHSATMQSLVGGGNGLPQAGSGVPGPPGRALPRRGARVLAARRWTRCGSRWSRGMWWSRGAREWCGCPPAS